MDLKKTAIYLSDRNVCYGEFIQRINHYAATLNNSVGVKDVVEQNLDAEQTPKILIFSENRAGWVYAFFSIWQNKYIAVTVDATATVEDVAYIINDCKPAAAWVSTKNLDAIKEAAAMVQHKMSFLMLDEDENTDIITMNKEGLTCDNREHATKSAIASLPAEELNDALKTLEMPKPAELHERTALLVYTSGTTGSPKGVMLSYRNIYSTTRSVSVDVPIITADRNNIMLLPVHHILPLMASVIVPFTSGGGVAICPSMVAADIMATLCRGKVGVFVGVPRLWQTLYNGIKKKIDEKAVTRFLFNLCSKVNNQRFSRFIFQSVHKKMGGHIDYMVSGGAALDKSISEGLRTLGFELLEGYGMTETSPIISFTHPGDVIPGCCGLPLPTIECKLINDELCVRGENVMVGYYKREKETADVIDKDGFLHTGDLARFDEKGRLYITGRCKEIIVLSNGKNVQPSEIEGKLERYADKVKESAVVQDGDMLRAIIVPQEEWAKGKTDAEIENLLKEEVLRPYNLTVENYKKLMSLMVFHGELPRTKLEKLQRFKLKDILNNAMSPAAEQTKAATPKVDEEQSQEFNILRTYIENEKHIAVRPNDHIETDLAFDSLDKVGLQSFIEQTFGMTINADTMAGYASIKEIADHIAKQHTRIEVEQNDWHTILLSDNNNDLKLPKAGAAMRLFASMGKAFLTTYNRMTIKGTENIPASGPFIIAPNHQSFLDGPIVLSGIPKGQLKDIYAYATEDHVRSALTRYAANHNNIIVMERQDLKNSILRLAQVLRQGKSILIFPEGTRTHSGDMGDFKKTFAILSKELNVPIIPVRITGAYRMLKRGSRFIKPCHVQVEYLPAVMPNESLTYEEIANIVKNRIKGS